MKCPVDAGGYEGQTMTEKKKDAAKGTAPDVNMDENLDVDLDAILDTGVAGDEAESKRCSRARSTRKNRGH